MTSDDLVRRMRLELLRNGPEWAYSEIFKEAADALEANRTREQVLSDLFEAERAARVRAEQDVVSLRASFVLACARLAEARAAQVAYVQAKQGATSDQIEAAIRNQAKDGGER